MNGEKLNEVLSYSLAKFKSLGSDPSSDFLEKVTFAEYKKLALLDVEAFTSLAKGVELYLAEHSEVLKMELELKKKKCALATSRKTLSDRFAEVEETLNKRGEKLKNEDFEFLKEKLVEKKPVFAKPEPPKEVPLVEPTYSTRVIREKPQPSNSIDSIMKPPTYSSSKFTKKENIPSKPCSLDESLINDPDITVRDVPCPRLNFDEIDDDTKTPVRSRATTAPKSASRAEMKPLNLSAMLRPPVFTSSSGKIFNQDS